MFSSIIAIVASGRRFGPIGKVVHRVIVRGGRNRRSGRRGEQGKAHGFALFHVPHAATARQVADTADIAGPLGDTDGAAGIQQIEGVTALEGEFIGRQHQTFVDDPLGFGLIAVEQVQQQADIGLFEIVGGLFHLLLVVHLAVGDGIVPLQVVDVVDALQVHGDALKAIGQLHGNGGQFHAAGLLEIGELGALHAVQPHFPA
ncbi:hypothetical protein DESC_100089 [Desulfosarcina cetonica]|nr:hypothetical protein DESC_100089 [Desulfosarcina cetonica]